jgi:hypothetical protein
LAQVPIGIRELEASHAGRYEDIVQAFARIPWVPYPAYAQRPTSGATKPKKIYFYSTRAIIDIWQKGLKHGK